MPLPGIAERRTGRAYGAVRERVAASSSRARCGCRRNHVLVRRQNAVALIQDDHVERHEQARRILDGVMPVDTQQPPRAILLNSDDPPLIAGTGSSYL